MFLGLTDPLEHGSLRSFWSLSQHCTKGDMTPPLHLMWANILFQVFRKRPKNILGPVPGTLARSLNLSHGKHALISTNCPLSRFKFCPPRLGVSRSIWKQTLEFLPIHIIQTPAAPLWIFFLFLVEPCWDLTQKNIWWCSLFLKFMEMCINVSKRYISYQTNSQNERKWRYPVLKNVEEHACTRCIYIS